MFCCQMILNYFYFSKELGDIFASIGVRELQPNASEGFAIFAECHRYVDIFILKSDIYYMFFFNIAVHNKDFPVSSLPNFISDFLYATALVCLCFI